MRTKRAFTLIELARRYLHYRPADGHPDAGPDAGQGAGQADDLQQSRPQPGDGERPVRRRVRTAGTCPSWTVRGPAVPATSPGPRTSSSGNCWATRTSRVPGDSAWHAPKEYRCPSDLVCIQERQDRSYTYLHQLRRQPDGLVLFGLVRLRLRGPEDHDRRVACVRALLHREQRLVAPLERGQLRERLGRPPPRHDHALQERRLRRPDPVPPQRGRQHRVLRRPRRVHEEGQGLEPGRLGRRPCPACGPSSPTGPRSASEQRPCRTREGSPSVFL